MHFYAQAQIRKQARVKIRTRSNTVFHARRQTSAVFIVEFVYLLSNSFIVRHKRVFEMKSSDKRVPITYKYECKTCRRASRLINLSTFAFLCRIIFSSRQKYLHEHVVLCVFIVTAKQFAVVLSFLVFGGAYARRTRRT